MPRTRLLLVASFIMSAPLLACGGSSSPDAGGMDAGATDLGTADTGGGGDASGDAAMDAGGDSGFGPEDCDPRSTTACMTGEHCGYRFHLAHPLTADFRCRLGGTLHSGATCTSSPYIDGDATYYTDDCGPGMLCAGVGAATQQCARVCSSRADCGTSDLCYSIGETAPGLGLVGICRPLQGCDPVAGTGCTAPLGCKLLPLVGGGFATGCAAKSALGVDEGCEDISCNDGFTCLRPLMTDGSLDLASEDVRCRQLCDPTASPTTCPTGGTCVAVTASGTAHYGFCTFTDPMPVGGTRPARVVVPASYDGTTPLPLVLALHPLSGDASYFDGLMRFSHRAQVDGFFLVLPEGMRDSHDVRYWNGTPACCDLDGAMPDDSTYLQGLIDEMKVRYHIDAARVYVFGYSDGGFMAYRMACDHADSVTAVASLGGATFNTESDCHASQPVSVLETHGDADFYVQYLGGTGVISLTTPYPGAQTTVERWATRAGCDLSMAVDGTPFEIDVGTASPETTPRSYTAGCTAGLDAELWTMHGSAHFVKLADDYTSRVSAWLRMHHR